MKFALDIGFKMSIVVVVCICAINSSQNGYHLSDSDISHAPKFDGVLTAIFGVAGVVFAIRCDLKPIQFNALIDRLKWMINGAVLVIFQ